MTNKDINLFDLQVENAINLQRNGEFEQARLIYNFKEQSCQQS